MDFLSTPLPNSSGTEEIVEKRRVGWNKGMPRNWNSGRKAIRTINGVLEVELKKKYGDTAPYHMKKYGHLDNIGKGYGAKPGNTNARRRIIEGKTVREWAELYGVSRPRVTAWFERHGTMKGCVPGKAGGWNKGQLGMKRSAESRAKQSLSSKGRTLTTEQKKIISEKAKQRWQDPKWVAKKSHKGRSMSLEEKEMRRESAKRRWANKRGK